MQTSGLFQPALIFSDERANASDPRRRRITSALLVSLLALAASLCVVLLIWMPSWPVTFWTNVATACLCALALLLVQRNHTYVAGLLAFVSVSLMVALDSLNPARSFGLAAPIVPVLLVFVAFLFGQRGLLAGALFSLVWMLAVVALKNVLWLDRPASVMRMQLIDASAYALYIAATTSAIVAAAHFVAQAQRAAVANAAALAQHARELEIEVAERKRLEIAHGQRAREMGKLLQISNTLTSTLQLHQLFDLILQTLKDVVEFDEAFIAEFIVDLAPLSTTTADPAMRQDARIVSLAGNNDGLAKDHCWHTALPRDIAITHVLDTRQPLVFQNLASDDAYTSSFRNWIVGNAGAPMRPMASAMVVPLVAAGNVLGLMVLCTTRKSYYDVHLADLALAFANQAAIAAENARLHGEAVRGAAFNERARLARDLHDSVSQSLYGIVLGAHTALAGREEPRRVASALEYVLKLAESGLTEMRALIRELRPEQLQEGSLGVVLQRQVEALCARHAISLTTVLLDDEPQLLPQTKEDAYRIAIEAANNAVKHSDATHIDLTVARRGASLFIEVRDNGRGFDTSHKHVDHYGLQGMSERAAALRASLHIDSANGSGTTVQLLLPIA